MPSVAQFFDDCKFTLMAHNDMSADKWFIVDLLFKKNCLHLEHFLRFLLQRPRNNCFTFHLIFLTYFNDQSFSLWHFYPFNCNHFLICFFFFRLFALRVSLLSSHNYKNWRLWRQTETRKNPIKVKLHKGKNTCKM